MELNDTVGKFKSANSAKYQSSGQNSTTAKIESFDLLMKNRIQISKKKILGYGVQLPVDE